MALCMKYLYGYRDDDIVPLYKGHIQIGSLSEKDNLSTMASQKRKTSLQGTHSEKDNLPTSTS